jgi:hypothetical protein
MIDMKRLLFASLVASVISTNTSAASVVQASAAGVRPQISRDVNGFSECGVRVMVLYDTRSDTDYYDFTLTLVAEHARGISKIRKYHVPKAAGKGDFEQYAVKAVPAGFWIVNEDEGKLPVQLIKAPGESAGSYIAAYDLMSATKLVLDIVGGERMQLAVQYRGQADDDVVAFTAKISEQDLQSFTACIKGMRPHIDGSDTSGD